MADPETVTVRDAPERRRYEAELDGALAGIVDYRLHGDRLALVHTEVMPPGEGRGVGSALARGALDDARARGLRVIPRCPFIAAYIRRHPEYADLVTTDAP
jgi:predicted GNAT family acetyltransferase